MKTRKRRQFEKLKPVPPKSRRAKKDVNAYPPGLIAVPCAEWVWTEFLNAFVSMVAPMGTGHAFAWDAMTVTHKRNLAVEEFLADKSYRWCLFLDSDMTPPPDTITRLLAPGKDIVTAVCVGRRPPFKICTGTLAEDGSGQMLTQFGGEHPVREVDWAGTACLLVRRRVFEAIASPWFEADPKDGAGSDIDFCAKARAAGFKLYCDTNLWVGHIGVKSVDLEQAVAWQSSEGVRENLKRSCQQPHAYAGIR